MPSVSNDSGHRTSSSSSYTWTGIAKVGFVAIVLMLCCVMGGAVCILALAVHQTALAERILQLTIGAWFVSTPVLGFVLRGRAGILLSIAACYGLIMPVVSIFVTDGGGPLASLLAMIMILAIASMHQPALLQFYKTDRPALSDYLLPAIPTILLFTAMVWS